MYNKVIVILLCFHIACAKINTLPSAINQDPIEIGDVDQFEVDKLGNIYVINTNAILTLYNKNKVKLYEYADQRLGKIDDIDVSNPMRIMLHFRDQGVVKILDNTLSELQRINLYDDGKFNSVGKICRANDNNLWIFDAQLQRIFKIDSNLKILNETNFFKDMDIKNFIPDYMRERNNNLLIADQSKRAIVFDNFGQYIKSFELDRNLAIHFDGHNLFLLSISGLHKQSISKPEITKVNIDGNHADVSEIKIENGFLYMKVLNKLHIHKLM